MSHNFTAFVADRQETTFENFRYLCPLVMRQFDEPLVILDVDS
jgi:hypothetical protein